MRKSGDRSRLRGVEKTPSSSDDTLEGSESAEISSSSWWYGTSSSASTSSHSYDATAKLRSVSYAAGPVLGGLAGADAAADAEDEDDEDQPLSEIEMKKIEIDLISPGLESEHESLLDDDFNPGSEGLEDDLVVLTKKTDASSRRPKRVQVHLRWMLAMLKLHMFPALQPYLRPVIKRVLVYYAVSLPFFAYLRWLAGSFASGGGHLVKYRPGSEISQDLVVTSLSVGALLFVELLNNICRSIFFKKYHFVNLTGTWRAFWYFVSHATFLYQTLVIFTTFWFQFLDFASSFSPAKEHLSLFWLNFMLENMFSPGGAVDKISLVKGYLFLFCYISATFSLSVAYFKVDGFMGDKNLYAPAVCVRWFCDLLQKILICCFLSLCKPVLKAPLFLSKYLKRTASQPQVQSIIGVIDYSMICGRLRASDKELDEGVLPVFEYVQKKKVQCVVVLFLSLMALVDVYVKVVLPDIKSCETEDFPNTLILLLCSVVHEKHWDTPISVEDLGLTEAQFDEKFIGSSEIFARNATLLKKEGVSALFRTTLGYEGEKRLDINFDYVEPPNVVIIMLESWMARETGALRNKFNYDNTVGETTDDHETPPPDSKWISPTPNFDKLSEKGLLFSNAWGNKMTTQSLEQILFGMLNPPGNLKYTVEGKNHNYRGMHTFMRQKGYDTIMSDAGDVGEMEFDNWHEFFRLRGYSSDQLWALKFHTKVAKDNDVRIGDSSLFWGLHDDITMQTLAIKIKEMNEARKTDKGQKPFYIHHYTISSHGPFQDRPSYYKPPNYSGQTIDDNHLSYEEMVHFVDDHVGKFFEEMKASGAMENTVFLLMGDHSRSGGGCWGDSHAPIYHHGREVPVLLLADGQLGGLAGKISNVPFGLDDTLSLFADLLGAPEGGFQQHGNGRSVLRKEATAKRLFARNGRRCTSQEGKYAMICKCEDGDACELYDVVNDCELELDVRRSVQELSEEYLLEWEKDIRALVEYEASKAMQNRNVPREFEPDRTLYIE